ncbi:Mu transposase domain-containing protein [Streptomyces sp. IBSNAI002]|uniref:Mu transposase domain-containing protein n=1 Tax=Streptomyces sp. IBSNAI002 TaxID=3457500 RepID=UPI003FD581F2
MGSRPGPDAGSPAVDPPAWWRFQTRLGRDHYVSVDTCDYSVDPAAIGRHAYQ